MANLKVRVYKNGNADPDTTFTIPAKVVQVVSQLIPRKAADALQEKGIDMAEIVALSQNPDVHGTLVEVEGHKKNERIVLSLE